MTLLQSAAERAQRYLDSLPQRRVAPAPAEAAGLAAFDIPLPDLPTDPEQVLAELDVHGSPGTVASAGPRYFGFVIGGSLPAALAANWLAGAWDQNVGLQRDVAHGGHAGDGGTGLAGGSVRAAAGHRRGFRHRRHHGELHRPRRRPPRAAGAGRLGRGGRWPVRRAADHRGRRRGGARHRGQGAGAGSASGASAWCACRWTGRGGMRADALPQAARPHASSACRPATSTPAPSTRSARSCAAAHAAGAWVHVDGAFGLWAAAAPARAHLAAGLAEADSWATDAHKWLNVPYDSGLAFVRDAEALRAAMARHAPPTCRPGRDARAGALHARAVAPGARGGGLGRAALAGPPGPGRADRAQLPPGGALRRGAARRRLRGAQRGGAQPGAGLVRRRRRAPGASSPRIQADGTCWCGGTVWQGRAAMRISVSSWATTDEDVEQSLEAMVRVARA